MKCSAMKREKLFSEMRLIAERLQADDVRPGHVAYIGKREAGDWLARLLGELEMPDRATRGDPAADGELAARRDNAAMQATSGVLDDMSIRATVNSHLNTARNHAEHAQSIQAIFQLMDAVRLLNK